MDWWAFDVERVNNKTKSKSIIKKYKDNLEYFEKTLNEMNNNGSMYARLKESRLMTTIACYEEIIKDLEGIK